MLLAGTWAVNCVALTKLVVSALPFHWTTAPETKPVPLTVRVKAGPPAVAESGLSEVITWPAVMVKVALADGTPFSTTVTLAGPAAAMRLAGTWAVNCVALTKVVVSALPFHWTTAPEAKPVPLTVRVKAAPPAVAPLGLSEEITGPPLIVKVAPPDVTPFSTTVTVTVPGAAIRLAATCAVNCMEFTKVVVSAVPFHWTTAPEAKPVPVTVKVNAGPPAVAEFGLSVVITGVAVMVKVALGDVTPFSTTVTVALPGAAMRAAPTCAVNCVALTKVVCNALLFHRTTAPETKPVPSTVNVKDVPPAVAEFGLSDVITGPEVTVKVAPGDVTPFSATVTVTLPGVVIRLAPTCAVNCVAFTKVVGNVLLFH